MSMFYSFPSVVTCDGYILNASNLFTPISRVHVLFSGSDICSLSQNIIVKLIFYITFTKASCHFISAHQKSSFVVSVANTFS